ncbi:TRAP transporter large permease subunit, partial [Yoonia sp.]|uniref:TRAP transporter large permease subunit n=1 Tax=Yoonia sp. TaxID=2212373 RepID=UPI0035C80198
MLFGLDGIEVGIIIVFLTLFAGILSGFPVAFAISGSAVVSFAIIAALDSSGLLIHAAVDTNSAEYAALLAEGVRPEAVSVFRYPELPRYEDVLFPQGWEVALDRNIGFMVNRMNERVLAGQSIETLLAVVMFVMMGIVLERSRIADELLTTMAKVFGPLPGGLAVSIVIVGAFLAASTGIVGATVVTMGLLALPTMLKNGYSPQLSTGVIAASGTLGQIIPPSIVIVLLGTLAGDIYSAAQEDRAKLAGCTDALTYLGEPAVVSVGTLFQAALLPGILLATLYAGYAFVYALINPSKAPPVDFSESAGGQVITRKDGLTWFLAVPAGIIVLTMAMGQVNLVGSQSVIVDSFTDTGESASLRTRVEPACQASMIALHGQDAWDQAVAEQQAIETAGGVTQARALSDEERAELVVQKVADAAPIGTGIAIMTVLMGLMLALARGVAPSADHRPLILGAFGVGLILLVDILLISAITSPGITTVLLVIPLVVTFLGLRAAGKLLAGNEILRVVFPPLVLIVAVLGSILGGITNPTPAAALGAGGAI